MNWINTVVRPKIRSILNRREAPENLWIKCPVSGEMVFHRDLENNQFVVPNSEFHMRLNATQRFGFLFDDADYSLIDLPDAAMDPLKFRDTKRYVDRMRDARAKTGKQDSVTVAQGTVEGLFLTAAVQDFTFLGGSLGMAAGEALITGILRAVEDKTPFVLFTASGGARMQEGILSLMQMPRTTVALQALREAGLPYILVLTDPTTGGVTASYAMLGDIQLAEPGALIGFAGQRVIEQTIREKLPEGFQRAEYLKEHGMVDMVVHRHDLPSTIARLCRFFTNTDTPEPKEAPVPVADLVEEKPAIEAEDVPAKEEAAPADETVAQDEPKAADEAEQETPNKEG
nr:acetyl-CoA carboxylase, carboxyltransferase subunit beta [uncultured Cohaesibacter sp.]